MHPKLYMVLLGCTPAGRNTEQHDIFFGIAGSLPGLKPAMEKFWPGTQLHIDAWRQVNTVDGFSIQVIGKEKSTVKSTNHLFFLNLGGYKKNEFEEFHYKMLTVAVNKSDAVKAGLRTAFYKHTSIPGPGVSHIDDRYGVDVDDIYAIRDILPDDVKNRYSILISEQQADNLPADELHLGYTKWSSLINSKS